MSFFSSIWNASAFLFLFAIASYLIIQLIISYSPAKNLLKEYGESYALITGGSSGIGKSLAKRLAVQGFNIVIIGSSEKHLNEAEEEIRKENAKTTIVKVQADFSVDGDGATNKVLEQVSDLDISIVALIAGIGFFESAAIPSQLTQSMVNTNISANQRLFYTLFPKLTKRSSTRKGLVVVTSSGLANVPVPFNSTYSATKAYWEAFGKSLALESGLHGVDTVVVVPGPVSTRFGQSRTGDPIKPNPAMQNADQVSALILQGATRFTVIDSGLMPRISRIFLHILGTNLYLKIVGWILPHFAAVRDIASGKKSFTPDKKL